MNNHIRKLWLFIIIQWTTVWRQWSTQLVNITDWFLLACSTGVFFGRANVFARKSAVLPKRGGNGESQRERWWGLAPSRLQGGKTFCASFCASLIAGSRRAFLCVDCVCLLLEFWVKCTRCERLLPVKHFYLKCLLFFVAWKLLWIQNNQC